MLLLKYALIYSGVKTMENVDTIIGTQLTTVQLHFTATCSEVVWVVQKKKE